MRYPTHLLLDKQYKKIDLQAPYWIVILWKQQVSLSHYKLPFLSFFNVKKKYLRLNQLLPCTLVHDRDFFLIAFLRKEVIYTKLKYSRTQSYDIVSAGVAALFAGFLGFLICEKFGFELLDSGDFLFLFLYVVIVIASIRTFVSLLRWNNQFSLNRLVKSVVLWWYWLGNEIKNFFMKLFF
uniref:hypothetical protein n=1 Tax=Bakuella subtropica TaxID=1295181 RepID=UPI0023F1E653|nr:hypothetical protein P4D19_mgp39 [Bakuella subtropica]WDY80862.1 hypothetical protein BKSUB_07 [Bakuella subtropica]